jgi:hypothetical protein
MILKLSSVILNDSETVWGKVKIVTVKLLRGIENVQNIYRTSKFLNFGYFTR